MKKIYRSKLSLLRDCYEVIQGNSVSNYSEGIEEFILIKFILRSHMTN